MDYTILPFPPLEYISYKDLIYWGYEQTPHRLYQHKEDTLLTSACICSSTISSRPQIIIDYLRRRRNSYAIQSPEFIKYVRLRIINSNH